MVGTVLATLLSFFLGMVGLAFIYIPWAAWINGTLPKENPFWSSVMLTFIGIVFLILAYGAWVFR